jgi:DNA-directed RNA polymerase specialized sigma24 family protein
MDETDPRSDGDLLVAARTDPAAFAAFYRRNVRGLLGFFRRRVATVEEAFDLTAETMAAALAGVPRYEPRPEPARVWLYGIAHNKLSEAFRTGPIDDRARQALAIEPIVVDERGYAEIARDLDLSESVVRQRVSGGLRTLRALLQDAADEQVQVEDGFHGGDRCSICLCGRSRPTAREGSRRTAAGSTSQRLTIRRGPGFDAPARARSLTGARSLGSRRRAGAATSCRSPGR